MASDVSIKLGVDGEKELKAALSAVTSQIKNLDSEMKAAVTSMAGVASEEELAAKKSDILGRSMDAAKQKISILNTQYEKAKSTLNVLADELEKANTEYGENSKEAAKAQTAYNKQATAVNNLGTKLNNATSDLNKMENEMDDVGKETEDATNSFNMFGTVLKANIVGDLISSGIRKMADSLVEFGKSAIEAGMNFEAQMSKVQAISGASASELEALENKAKEMGESTVFSATESAEALEYMAMAGWKTEDMISGLEGVMYLAAASGEELSTTSDIVTDALTAFGLKAEDSGHFADVLAAASSSANTNVGLMGSTFQYVAPLAGSLGYSVEDVAVAIGLMANAGIKGDQAGTNLRATLTNLAKPTKQVQKYINNLGVSLTDAQGEIRPFSELVRDLRVKFKDLSEAQKVEYAAGIAGKEAMSGLLAIINTSDDDFEKLTASIDSSNGAAEAMTSTMNDNLQGSVTLAKSALEGLSITIYESCEKQLKSMVDTFTNKGIPALKNFAIAVIENKDEIIRIAAPLAGLTAGFIALKTALSIGNTLQTVTSGIKTLITGLTAATTAQGGLNAVMLANPYTLVATAIGAVVAVLGTLAISSLAASKNSDELTQRINEQTEAWKDMNSASKETAEDDIAKIEHAEALAYELESLTDATGRVSAEEQDRAEGLYTTVNELLPGLIEKTGEGTEATYQFAGSIKDVVEQQKALAIQEAYRDDYIEAIKSKKEASEQLAEALANLATYQEKYNEALANGDDSSLQYYGELITKTEELITKNTELTASYDETIANFENLNEAIAAGDYDKAAQSVSAFGLSLEQLNNLGTEELQQKYNDLTNSIKALEDKLASDDLPAAQKETFTSLLEELKLQQPQYEEALKNMGAAGPEAFASGTNGNKSAAVDASKTVAEESAAQFEISPIALIHGQEGTENYASGLRMSQSDAESAAEAVAKATSSSLEITDKTPAIGKSAIIALAQGMSSESGTAETASSNVASKAKTAADKKTEFESVGGNLVLGLAGGITAKMQTAINAAATVAKAIKNLFTGTTGFDTHSPSKWAIALMEYVDEGFAKGLLNKKDLPVDAASDISDEIKTGFTSKLKAATIGVKIVKALTTGVKASEKSSVQTAKDVATKVKNAMSTQIERLNEELAKAEQEESDKKAEKELADYKSKLQTKYDELEAAELKNKAKIQSEIAKLEDEWNESQEEKAKDSAQAALKAQLSALEDLQSEYEKALDEIDQKQTSMADKMKAYGELLETISTEDGDIIKLGDLSDDIAQLTKYNDQLERLKYEKAAPESLLDEVLSMSIDDAIAYSSELLSLSDKSYQAYIEQWNKKQELASKAASEFYSSELESLNKEFIDKLPEGLSTLKSEMETVGVETGKGLASGLNSQLPNLKDTAYRMASEIISTMREALDIHSPSRVAAKLVGTPTAQGVVGGILETMKESKAAISQAVLSPLNSVKADDIYKAAEASVNGIAAVDTGASTQTIIIPINLNGTKIAEVVFDPLKDISKQRGVSLA